MITVTVSVRQSGARRVFRWVALYMIRPLVILLTVAFILCGGFIFLLPFVWIGQMRRNSRRYVVRSNARRTQEPASTFNPAHPYDGI